MRFKPGVVLAVVAAMAVVIISSVPAAHAQQPAAGTVEFSTLAGLALFQAESDGDDFTTFGLPGVFSYPWRMTFWTNSPVAVEAAIGFLSLSFENDNETVLFLEGGASYFFASENGNTLPYIGGTLGVLSLSGDGDSGSDTFSGIHAGVRMRLREHSGVRFQGGYRFVLSDTDISGVFELGGGLSFML